jgi:hypothetical protein
MEGKDWVFLGLSPLADRMQQPAEGSHAALHAAAASGNVGVMRLLLQVSGALGLSFFYRFGDARSSVHG